MKQEETSINKFMIFLSKSRGIKKTPHWLCNRGKTISLPAFQHMIQVYDFHVFLAFTNFCILKGIAGRHLTLLLS